ncbi:hypothetical protein Q5530_00960 [Saccharothrix sp. BKS2]|uniref:hypothetical protein n=1 Tax=Saccharothrix sp. BKS2 TaxID=3064400 RepID=UPI0039EB895E
MDRARRAVDHDHAVRDDEHLGRGAGRRLAAARGQQRGQVDDGDLAGAAVEHDELVIGLGDLQPGVRAADLEPRLRLPGTGVDLDDLAALVVVQPGEAVGDRDGGAGDAVAQSGADQQQQAQRGGAEARRPASAGVERAAGGGSRLRQHPADANGRA